jgi:hypothetical protein
LGSVFFVCYILFMAYKDKQKQAEYQNQWTKHRRLEWVQANGPCKDCGSHDSLEVHHIDRSKKVSHRVWSWNAVKRAKELAKCCVLCRACHKRHTAIDRRAHWKHGLYNMYVGGCRCVDCKGANASRVRVWRNRTNFNTRR